jgi:hypothetical protein
MVALNANAVHRLRQLPQVVDVYDVPPELKKRAKKPKDAIDNQPQDELTLDVTVSARSCVHSCIYPRIH